MISVRTGAPVRVSPAPAVDLPGERPARLAVDATGRVPVRLGRDMRGAAVPAALPVACCTPGIGPARAGLARSRAGARTVAHDA